MPHHQTGGANSAEKGAPRRGLNGAPVDALEERVRPDAVVPDPAPRGRVQQPGEQRGQVRVLQVRDLRRGVRPEAPGRVQVGEVPPGGQLHGQHPGRPPVGGPPGVVAVGGVPGAGARAGVHPGRVPGLRGGVPEPPGLRVSAAAVDGGPLALVGQAEVASVGQEQVAGVEVADLTKKKKKPTIQKHSANGRCRVGHTSSR